LDSVILPYIKYFIDREINGQKLLDMQPNDLDKIGVCKIGHQELILEAVDLLRNFVSNKKIPFISFIHLSNFSIPFKIFIN
jgi:connector enhancer of kinase suppressor of Ras 2